MSAKVIAAHNMWISNFCKVLGSRMLRVWWYKMARKSDDKFNDAHTRCLHMNDGETFGREYFGYFEYFLGIRSNLRTSSLSSFDGLKSFYFHNRESRLRLFDLEVFWKEFLKRMLEHNTYRENSGLIKIHGKCKFNSNKKLLQKFLNKYNLINKKPIWRKTKICE